MARKVLKRAALIFVALLGTVLAIAGALLWYHTSLANPCPDGLLNGEPVMCYHRLYFTGIDDWPWALAALVLAFAICVLASWLSQQARRSSRSGAA